MQTHPPSVPGDRPAPSQRPSTASGAVSAGLSGWQSQSPTHGFQTFSQYSEFLRTSVADEESLQVGESLKSLAVQVEALLALLQRRGTASPALSVALINLLGDLRAHRALLLELGEDWHRFYEFDAHFAALNHFRLQVTQWAMDAAPPHSGVPPLSEFDLSAWRVLGAGSLLLDVYDQSSAVAQEDVPERRPPTLWARLKAWWLRRRSRDLFVRKGERRGRRGRRRTD